MLFAGAPIGIAAILQALNLRLDILTLSPFASNRVLGNYQAAAWFPVGAFLFVSLLMTTLFPKVARLLRNPGKQRNDYIESLLKNGVLLMTVGSIVVGLLAPYLLRVLFGGRLVSAVSALRILVLALPCIFINTTLFYLFVAAQRRSAYLTALLLGVFAGGALSVVLSARYGPNGTALAYVLREFFVSVVYLCFLKAGDFAQSAGRALLRILACATALIVLVILLANSTIFGAAWSLALVAGTVIFMGRPRLQEMLLLVDDDL
jgi:O-antigen/teichoic acid export membrane protein